MDAENNPQSNLTFFYKNRIILLIKYTNITTDEKSSNDNSSRRDYPPYTGG
jgi:hypothetical protein